MKKLEERKEALAKEYEALGKENQKLNEEGKKINQRLSEIRAKQLSLKGAYDEIISLIDKPEAKGTPDNPIVHPKKK